MGWLIWLVVGNFFCARHAVVANGSRQAEGLEVKYYFCGIIWDIDFWLEEWMDGRLCWKVWVVDVWALGAVALHRSVDVLGTTRLFEARRLVLYIGNAINALKSCIVLEFFFFLVVSAVLQGASKKGANVLTSLMKVRTEFRYLTAQSFLVPFACLAFCLGIRPEIPRR